MAITYNLHIDSPIETYAAMKRHVQTLKGVPGISCEIGLRRAGGTLTMMNGFYENRDPRVHVCIDPYGNIPYNDIAGTHKSDYTNRMKNETLSELYRYANDNDFNIIFFNLEDSEFYQRFADGVPIYIEEKKIVNEYCCVHIDGQHDVESVMVAAEFFSSRTPAGAILFFDNTDHYRHDIVDDYLKFVGFEFLEDVKNKKIYRKV
jgi:hypothetical protein